MRKAGGIVALIAGIFGILAAGFTLLFGGVTGHQTIVGLGWGGVAFSFIVIAVGAVAMGSAEPSIAAVKVQSTPDFAKMILSTVAHHFVEVFSDEESPGVI